MMDVPARLRPLLVLIALTAIGLLVWRFVGSDPNADDASAGGGPTVSARAVQVQASLAAVTEPAEVVGADATELVRSLIVHPATRDTDGVAVVPTGRGDLILAAASGDRPVLAVPDVVPSGLDARSVRGAPLAAGTQIPGDDAVDAAFSNVASRTADAVVLVPVEQPDLGLASLSVAARAGGVVLPVDDADIDERVEQLRGLSPATVVLLDAVDSERDGPDNASRRALLSIGKRLAVDADVRFAVATPNGVEAVLGRHLTPVEPRSVWLMRPDDPAGRQVRVLAGLNHVQLLAHDEDPRQPSPLLDAIRTGEAPLELSVGTGRAAPLWKGRVALEAEELPGGGLMLFPHRRMVAMYGHTAHGSLGILGEQSAEAGVARVKALSAPYAAIDDEPVLPTYEIIATLATAGPTADGDYSQSTDLETLRQWHRVARSNGIYTVLDIQPGRTDFLTELKVYDELLREPDVGVALDPEWRLKPNERHLRQIGQVDAAEVNMVVDYLSEMVRDETLPQKLLIVHQFQERMLTNRDQLKIPDELAVMIHMDGQGGHGSKRGTYSRTNPPDAPFWHGWKNFYDEDVPGVMTPEQTLDNDPEPLFISYQ